MIPLFGILFLFGAMVGSFVVVLVRRTHEHLPIGLARSRCPACRHMLSWRDNIPLLSFFLLRGACRYCAARIPLHYPTVEAATGLLFLVAGAAHGVAQTGVTAVFVRDLFLVSLLAVIFLYDFWYGEILDRFTTIPAAILFFLSLYFRWGSAASLGLGVLFGAGFFLLQFLFSRGRWIGGGDIRLGVLMGTALGSPKIFIALFLSYVFGAAVSMILLFLKKKKLTDETPFGTYLTLGTAVTMFWGEPIAKWYGTFFL